MIHGTTIGLMLAAALAPAAPDAAVSATAKADRRILQRCGAAEAKLASAPDADWAPATSVAPEHATLRAALHEPMPDARSTVSIHGFGGDLATTEFSVIVARGDDGTWRGTAVGQSTIWIRGAKPTITPRREWTLPPDKGKRMDALLADRCFYAEPTVPHAGVVPAVGVLNLVLETRTPRRARTVSYYGGAVEGLTAEVAALTFPPN